MQLKRTSRLPPSSNRPVRRFLEPRHANAIPPIKRMGNGVMAAYAATLVVAPDGAVSAAKLDGAMTVRVAFPVLVPSVTEAGDTLQAASGADPFTVQLKFTWPEKPFCTVTVKASVVCAPVCNVRDADAAARAKSGAGANVAVTDSAVLIVTVQLPGSLPLQAPLQAERIDPAAGVAFSATDVPCAKLPEHVLPQLMAPGFEVTVPEPLPASVTLSVTRATTLRV